MKQSYIIILGFIFFFLGALSIVLSLVGLKLDILGAFYKISPGFALLVHLIFLFGGVCLIYYAKNMDRMKREMADSE
jgi:hypothetical protein